MAAKKVALSIIYIVAWLCILLIFIIPLAAGVASLPFIPIGSGAFTGFTLWQEIGVYCSLSLAVFQC